MKKFTIIGYYEDSGRIWEGTAQAEDSNDAVVKIVTRLEEHSEDKQFFRENLCIVGIFEGIHHNENEAESVSSAIDWPGLEDVE
jgi:hypothetical protein